MTMPGNELASETVPPTEPFIMAGNRKLADPASTWNESLSNCRNCSMPLEALSFMPTIPGWAASRPASAGDDRHAAEPRRVVDQQREGRSVRQGGEVAEQHIVGHLLPEISGRQDQPEIRSQIGGLLEKPLGVALGVVGGAGHDHLARALVLHDGARHAELLLFREAAVFAVRAQGEIAQHAALRVAGQVEPQGVVIDRFVIGERRRDGDEDPGHFLQQLLGIESGRGGVHRRSYLILSNLQMPVSRRRSCGAPILGTSLDHQHDTLGTALKSSRDFVAHSLRHTMLTPARRSRRRRLHHRAGSGGRGFPKLLN